MASQKFDSASRITNARNLFSNGYNCSQAVAMSFQDRLGLKEEDILRAMSGFGFGMGGERSVCGAVSGGIFVLSSLIKDPLQRAETYDQVFYLIDQFKKQHEGKLNCLDIIGENPTDIEFRGICPVLIEEVVKIMEEMQGNILS